MKKSQKTLFKRRFRLFLPFSLALAAALLAAPVVFPASEALSLPSFAALQSEELSGNVLTLPGGEDEGEGEFRSADGEATTRTDGGTKSGTDGEIAEAPGEKSVDVWGVFLILLISAATVSGIVSGIPREDRV